MYQAVKTFPELIAAEVSILTMVSLNERARGLPYSEGETDLVIEYCEIQRGLNKTVALQSFKLQQKLFCPLSSALQEIACGRLFDFLTGNFTVFLKNPDFLIFSQTFSENPKMS